MDSGCGVDDLLRCMNAMELNKLQDDWVKEVQSNGFSEFVEFPEIYTFFFEMAAFHESLEYCSNVLKRYLILSPSNDTDDSHFKILRDSGFDLKLVCVIGNTLAKFHSEAPNEKNFFLALQSAKVYLLLAAIPGSYVYCIFNPVLYKQAIKIFEVGCQILKFMLYPHPGVAKAKKRRRNDSDDLVMASTAVWYAQLEVDPVEIVTSLIQILKPLQNLLEIISCDNELMPKTVAALMLAGRLEYKRVLNEKPNDKRSVYYLSFASYFLVQNICKINHAAVFNVISIARSLMFVKEEVNLGINSIPAISNLRKSAVVFFGLLARTCYATEEDRFLALFQRMLDMVPDKAECRIRASELVIDFITDPNMPPKYRMQQIKMILFMAYLNNSSRTRVFAVENIHNILVNCPAVISVAQEEKEGAPSYRKPEFFLAVLLERCADVAPAVSIKAMSYLEHFICAKNGFVAEMMRNMLEAPFVENEQDYTKSPAYKKRLPDLKSCLINDDVKVEEPLPGVEYMFRLIHMYATSEKVLQRYRAFNILAKLYLCYPRLINSVKMMQFVKACGDTSIMVRKSAMQILTELLLEYPHSDALIRGWVRGVCPLIVDNESRIKEKALEIMDNMIFRKIKSNEDTLETPSDNLPWRIVQDIVMANKRKFLTLCTKESEIQPSLLSFLYSHINTKKRGKMVWYILESIADQKSDLVDAYQIYHHFIRAGDDFFESDVSLAQIKLKILYSVLSHFNSEEREIIMNVIQIRVVENKLDITLLTLCCNISHAIMANIFTDIDMKNVVRGERLRHWVDSLIELCEECVISTLSPKSPITISMQEAVLFERRVCLLGHLGLVCPQRVQQSTVELLKNAISVKGKKIEGGWQGKVSEPLESTIVVALGKFAFANESMTKWLVTSFTDILGNDSYKPNSQINAIMALCELFKIHTSALSRSILNVVICMKSQKEEVRECAMKVMIELTKKNYVRLQENILYPLLISLTDLSANIRGLANNYVAVELRRKGSFFVDKHLLGFLFFANALDSENFPNKMDKKLQTIFSLKNEEKHCRDICVQVINVVADIPQRFMIMKRFAKGLFELVADECMEYDDKVRKTLLDAFYILKVNGTYLKKYVDKRTNTRDEDEVDLEEYGAEENDKKTKAAADNAFFDFKGFLPDFVTILSHLQETLKSKQTNVKYRKTEEVQKELLFTCFFLFNTFLDEDTWNIFKEEGSILWKDMNRKRMKAKMNMSEFAQCVVQKGMGNLSVNVFSVSDNEEEYTSRIVAVELKDRDSDTVPSSSEIQTMEVDLVESDEEIL